MCVRVSLLNERAHMLHLSAFSPQVRSTAEIGGCMSIFTGEDVQGAVLLDFAQRWGLTSAETSALDYQSRGAIPQCSLFPREPRPVSSSARCTASLSQCVIDAPAARMPSQAKNELIANLGDYRCLFPISYRVAPATKY